MSELDKVVKEFEEAADALIATINSISTDL